MFTTCTDGGVGNNAAKWSLDKTQVKKVLQQTKSYVAVVILLPYCVWVHSWMILKIKIDFYQEESSMMLQLVRRPYRLTKEFERAHIQLTRTWWTPLLEYQQARSFEQFALHIRAVNRSIKTAVIVGFAAAYIHGIPTLNKEKCLVVCLNLPGDRPAIVKTMHRNHALSRCRITRIRYYRGERQTSDHNRTHVCWFLCYVRWIGVLSFRGGCDA